MYERGEEGGCCAAPLFPAHFPDFNSYLVIQHRRLYNWSPRHGHNPINDFKRADEKVSLKNNSLYKSQAFALGGRATYIFSVS